MGSDHQKIVDYFETRKDCPLNANMDRFSELANSLFGEADESTLKFREECRSYRATVVFRAGLDREETLNILKHEDTTRILADPDGDDE